LSSAPEKLARDFRTATNSAATPDDTEVPYVTNKPPKSVVGAVILTILGILFTFGSISGFSEGDIGNGIVSLLIGGTCIFFGFVRPRLKK
jgi:hypothetical protein